MNKGESYWVVGLNTITEVTYLGTWNNKHIVSRCGAEEVMSEEDFRQEFHWSFDTKREAYAEMTLQRLKSAYQSACMLTDEELDAIEWWANLDFDTAWSYESEFRLGMLSPRIDELLKIYRNAQQSI